MPTDTDPVIDNWYENPEEGQRFRVAAVDDTAGLVEIEYPDGNLEEMDIEAWYLLDIEPLENPDDWTNDLDQDDDDFPDSDLEENIWDARPRAARDRGMITDSDDQPADDWGKGFPEEDPWE